MSKIPSFRFNSFKLQKFIKIRNVECGDAHSFCGLQDQLYPDRRPMGFPFDRPFDVSTLDEFVDLHSNMFVQDVNIRFVDEIVNRAP